MLLSALTLAQTGRMRLTDSTFSPTTCQLSRPYYLVIPVAPINGKQTSVNRTNTGTGTAREPSSQVLAISEHRFDIQRFLAALRV